jgi:cytochrome c oxidase cbb3-type subunit 3
MDRLHHVKPWRGWTLAGACGLIVAATGAWAVSQVATDVRLLKIAPRALPQDHALMAWAAGRGAGVYRGRCQGCHGPAGRGDPTHGVPDLTDGDWLYGEGDIADIEAIVAHGIRAHAPRTLALADMPAYAHERPSATEPIPPLPPADLRDMVEYVVWMSGRPADRAAVARAAQVYQTRGGCYDCHGRDGGGDAAIGAPRLTDSVWLYGGTRAEIAQSLAQGRHGVSPAFLGRLSPVQIREAAAYVYALSHPERGPRT